MRSGLRSQLLLLIGVVLVAGFVPLHFAVSTYSRLALRDARVAGARALGRAIGGQVAEARARRAPGDLEPLLAAHTGPDGAVAVAAVDLSGARVSAAGDLALLDAVGPVDPAREAVRRVTGPAGDALLVVVPDPGGAVLTLVPSDADSARVASLARLAALYMGLVGAALLLALHFGVTRVIVRPLDALGRAAERVAGGSRRLDAPPGGARELTELGDSLRTMTERLLEEERALRRQIDEVELRTAELRAAHAQLVRSERLASVGTLAAGLAHEIGNPLAAILGMQALLLEGGLDAAEQRDFLQRMHRETERVNGILRSLLDFARPATQNAPGSATPGDVALAADDTLALLAPQRSMARLGLTVEVPRDLPAVPLSREQLVQVLLNLVLNASDACGEGGRIAVRASTTGGRVHLEVEDDGPGIAAEIRDRLFEPFVTTKEVGKGTGLGLAVCRGLVEGAGGTIRAEPAEPRGARFVIELPPAS